MTSEISTEAFNTLYDTLSSYVNPLDNKLDNFVPLLAKCMEIVHKWSESLPKNVEIHGLQKKEIVIALMSRLSEKFFEDKEQFDLLAHSIMPKLIDTFIASAKGHLMLNTVEMKTVCCLPPRKNRKANRDAPTEQLLTVEAAVDKVYNDVKIMIVNKQFTVSSFIMLVTTVMQDLGQIGQLTGPQKKNVAVQVISKIVHEIPIPGINEEVAGVLIKTVLSKTIDLVVAAASGEFNFTNLKEKAKLCCKA